MRGQKSESQAVDRDRFPGSTLTEMVKFSLPSYAPRGLALQLCLFGMAYLCSSGIESIMKWLR